MTRAREFDRRLAAFTGVGAFALVVAAPVSADRPLAWLLVSGGVGLFVSGIAWRARSATPDEERPLERLGAANSATLFRGWLLAGLAGFLVSEPAGPWLPVVVFVAAGVLDAVDGAVARRTRETALGTRLDTSTDALAVLVGSALGVALAVLPVWYLLAGAVWYVYAAGLWLRQQADKPVYDLPESRLRPLVGAAQLAVIGAALLPAFGPPETTFTAAFALAALCASFGRDWAAATGRLGRDRARRASIAEND